MHTIPTPAVIGSALARVRREYEALSSFGSGHAGPAFRRAILALEDWRDNARPGDADALAGAAALCEAGENLRHFDTVQAARMIDHPAPSIGKVWKGLLRTAERLSPGILDAGQREACGV